MSIVINDSLKLIFLTLPKCASTYMEKILLQYYNFKIHSNTETRDIKLIDQNSYVKNIIDNNFDIYNMGEIYYNYQFFSLVRNPYEKFLSGFLYFYGKQFVIDGIKKRKCYEGQCISAHSNMTDNNISHLNSLDEVIKNKDDLYTNNISAYGHLFILQSSLLNSISHQKIIKKVEDMPNSLNEILTGFNIDIIHQDHPKENDIIKYYYIYEYFTDYSIEFINNYFNDDFINFGYTKFNNIEEMTFYYRTDE